MASTSAPTPLTPHGRAKLIALGRATKPIREASGMARFMFWTGVGITLFFIVLPILEGWNVNAAYLDGLRRTFPWILP